MKLNIISISLFGIGVFILYGMILYPTNNEIVTNGTVCTCFFFGLGLLNLLVHRNEIPELEGVK